MAASGLRARGHKMILILGAGAVGSTLAAYLSAARRKVALHARPSDLERLGAISRIRLTSADGRLLLDVARPPLVEDLRLQGVTTLILAVKYPALAAVIDTLPDPIPDGCTLVSTLNGVAPLRLLRERRPGARVFPMSVMMNLQCPDPLQIHLTTAAEVVLGTDDAQLRQVFDCPGLRLRCVAGDEAVWGKLLINLANAICALTGATFRDLFVDPDLRRIYVAVLDEATTALDAAGIAWKLPLAVPFATYRWMLLHGGPLPWWVARWRNGVREGAYPSMVADVRAGRETEVGQLNGEIVRLGARTGRPTPVNACLVEWIGASRRPAPMDPAGMRATLRL